MVDPQRSRVPTSFSLSAPDQPQFSTIPAASLTGSNERDAALTSGNKPLPGHPRGTRAESQDPQTQGPDLLGATERVEGQREAEVPQSPRPAGTTLSALWPQTPHRDSEIFEEGTQNPKLPKCGAQGRGPIVFV